jgi:hypothetical protein
MFKLSISCVLAFGLLVACCSELVAQTWSYQGSSSCFHTGNNVQCFESGTLRSYATNREQFDSAYRNGQVMGQGIGLLIQAWMAHRRQLELERKNAREQISTYYHATYELNDEVMHYEDVLVSSFNRLAQLDPPRRAMYEDAARGAQELSARLAQMRPMTEKNLPGILGAKDIKFLNSNLELSRNFYNQATEAAKKEYVFSQFLGAYTGYLEFRQNASKPAVVVAASAPASVDSDVASLKAVADAGDGNAQAMLGKMYLEGNRVPQSYATAAKWFRLAAMAGNAESQVAIGDLLEQGRGIIQDYVQAHMWFNLAAAAGVPEAESRRNTLAAKMTPEQIAEAQKLAANWKPETRKE